MLKERMVEIEHECAQFPDSFGLYSFVTELSVYLPEASESLRTDSFRIRDCQSAVWLRQAARDGLYFMEADSDSMILRGILYIMEELYNGCPVQEIADTDIDFFEMCRLGDTLTASRNKGIRSVSEKVRKFCRETVSVLP